MHSKLSAYFHFSCGQSFTQTAEELLLKLLEDLPKICGSFEIKMRGNMRGKLLLVLAFFLIISYNSLIIKNQL